jgi:hypothetical protein
VVARDETTWSVGFQLGDFAENPYSGYNPHTATFSPWYFNASLIAYSLLEGSTTMEFTATEHAALMRVRFPNGMAAQNEGNVLRRVLIILNDATVDTIGNGSKTIWGSTRTVVTHARM